MSAVATDHTDCEMTLAVRTALRTISKRTGRIVGPEEQGSTSLVALDAAASDGVGLARYVRGRAIRPPPDRGRVTDLPLPNLDGRVDAKMI